MTTSSGSNGPLDEETLQRIANAIFRAEPGESPHISAQMPQAAAAPDVSPEFPDLIAAGKSAGAQWLPDQQEELRSLGITPERLIMWLSNLPAQLDRTSSRPQYGGPTIEGPHPSLASTPSVPSAGPAFDVPVPLPFVPGVGYPGAGVTSPPGSVPLSAAVSAAPFANVAPGSRLEAGAPSIPTLSGMAVPEPAGLPSKVPGLNVPSSGPASAGAPLRFSSRGPLSESFGPLDDALELLKSQVRQVTGGASPTAPADSAILSRSEQKLASVKQATAFAAPSFYFLDDAKVVSEDPLQFRGSEPQLPLRGVWPSFDVGAVRRDFPILSERVNGQPLIWLDNAATTQKPKSVIDRLTCFYEHENSNIHRAAHTLAARATDAYEQAREKVRAFLGASSTNEIIFVRGTTEAINLIAQSWGRQNIEQGDEILITWLEHHANIVPWQQLAKEKGARLKVAPVDDLGQVMLDDFGNLLGPKVKLVAFTHVSNALGTITPVKEMIQMARHHGAKVLVDGAQAVSHLRVNVQDLDPDFYVFSGHKIFGPTGIGVVYGKEGILNSMPPFQTGGNMITDVTFERSLFQKSPARFEAGTGNIADAVGLGAALDYVNKIGLEKIAEYEHQLLCCLRKQLKEIPGIRLIGGAREKTSVTSFVIDGFSTEEIGQALSKRGIAVRAGHHCAQPILRRFGVEATVRPSLAFYNTREEIDALIDVLYQLVSSRRRG